MLYNIISNMPSFMIMCNIISTNIFKAFELYLINRTCFGCFPAHRGLPVGFLLLRYSVLFTVESLSLLYLLVIS